MILYKALYDYESEQSCDLQFKKNDIIKYESQSSSSWYNGKNLMTGKSGIFPYNFVIKIELPKIDSNFFIMKKSLNEFRKGEIIVAQQLKNSEVIGYAVTDKEQKSVSIPQQVLIEVDQSPTNERFSKCLAHTANKGSSRELCFNKGDVIWMMKKLDDNIGEGIFDGKKGTFSLSKVHIEDNEDSQSIDRKNRWVALFEYNSCNKNDLKLTQNEKLKFLDRIDNNWLLMKNESGEVGMVPYNFVKNISVMARSVQINCEDKEDIQVNIAQESIINELKNYKPNSLGNDDVKKDCDAQDNAREFDPINYYKDENNYDFIESPSTFTNQEQTSESLFIELEKKEKIIENEMEVLMNDILSIKKNLSRQEADQEDTQLISNNLAFLKEEYQEKQKQLSLIKQQKKIFLKGEDVTDGITLLNNVEIEKKYKMKTKAIDEVLETEIKFINDMKLTLTVFNLVEMKNKISEQDYNCIFGDLDAIIKISEHFQLDLSIAVDDYGAEVPIGSIFLKFLDSFEAVYKEYCVTYDKKLELINKKPRSQEMEEFIKEGLSRLNESGTMISCVDTMLVKPLQRFLKYPLFMKNIIQNTNEGHADMVDLQSALLQFEIIAKRINEKKRFEELRTEIFERSGLWHQKTLHAIQKVPKRFLVASLYGSQQDDDLEYHDAVLKFKNLKKCISFFIETVIVLRDNLKDVLTTYSALNENLHMMMSSTFGSQLHQYIIICKNGESNYYKKYYTTHSKTAALESLVIIPLSKLLELFPGPKLLIKKRKSKFLDYLAMKQNKEVTKIHPEKLEVLNNQYLAINNTLKNELPILTSKSKEIFNECLANYLQLTTSTLQTSIDCLRTLIGNEDVADEEQRNYRNIQMEILNNLQRNMLTYNSRNDLQRVELSSTNPRKSSSDSLSRSDYYYQTDDDVMNLKIKFEPKNLAYVKKNFVPTKPHQISISKNNIVGIVKRCDPQGHGSSWLVEVSQKRVGFVPRSYLNSVPFTKDSQYAVEASQTMRSSPHLNKRHSMFNPSSNMDLMEFSPNGPIVHSASLFKDPQFQKIRVALFDFKSTGQTDISMMKDDHLRVIESHDKAGNTSWSLVKNLRTGAQGYVPTNYMSGDF